MRLPEAVRVTAFARAALPLARADDGFLLDLAAARLGGAWVSLLLAGPAGSAGALAGLRLGPDRVPGPLLHGAPAGPGRTLWTGRLPDDARALRLDHPQPGRPPDLTRIEIRPHARAAVAARALARAPGLALAALGWRLVGKRRRGRALLERALDPGPAEARVRRLDPEARRRIRAAVAGWADPPRISVAMPVHDPAPRVLRAALRSVAAQLYPHWELCVCDDASTRPAVRRILARAAARDPRIRLVRRTENGHIARATNDALALATGAYVAFLDHDDELAEEALYAVAEAVRADPGLVLLYSDEDKIDRRGRRFDPHRKPAFDPDLLYGQNYLNHLTVVRCDALAAAGGLRPGFEGSQDHDLVLRLTDGLDPARIRHIPQVLYHWRAGAGSGSFSDRALARAEAARLRALAEVVAPRGWRAERGPRGFNRVVRPLPVPPPPVALVLPLAAGAPAPAALPAALFGGADDPPCTVTVVGAGPLPGAGLRGLAAPEAESRAARANRGAAAAAGGVLVFLDPTFLDAGAAAEPGWLTELVAQALRPEVGAVGARILAPDRTVRHGGMILGIGGTAGPGYRGLPEADPGYFCRMLLARACAAVAGGCLAVRAEVFAALGGFDAAAFPDSLSEVDFCLRARAAGLRVLWTPFATLVRPGPERPEDPAEAAAFRARWGAVLDADPFYGPRLSRASGYDRPAPADPGTGIGPTDGR